MMQSAIDAFAGDLKRALRSLRQDLGFSVVATLILGLAIGGAASLFTLINALIIRPLPYFESHRLVHAAQSKEGRELSPSWPNFMDWKSQSRSFRYLAGSFGQEFTLTGAAGAERERGQVVTFDFFTALGTAPGIGRTFQPADDRPGAEPVAILSYSLWQRRFAGRADVIGTVVNLDARPFTIIGVLPASFRYYQPGEVFVPVSLFPDKQGPRWNRQGMTVIGRLESGVSLTQAKSEMDLLAARLASEYPEENAGNGIVIEELSQRVAGKTGGILWTLFGAVLLALAIGCANIANMQLARGLARQKEVAISFALGASRLRIAASVLTESLLLALFGGLLGLALASAGSGLMVQLLPPNLIEMTRAGVDLRVLLSLCAALTAIVCIFGLIPALQASKVDLRGALAERQTGHRRSMSLRSALAVLQIAFTVTLLIGSALMARSMYSLLQLDPGFHRERTVTAQVYAPFLKYPGSVQIIGLYDRLLSGVGSYPGFEAAGLVGCLPLGGSCFRSLYQVEGQPVGLRENLPRLDMNIADEGYFRTLQIPLTGGRTFEPRDNAGSDPVVIVSEAVVKRFWPNENPIGKHLTPLGPKEGLPRRTVIGVVRDVRRLGLDTASEGEVYVPFRQFPLVRMNLVVRAHNGDHLAGAIKSALHGLDPEIPLYRYRTLSEMTMDSLSHQRLLVIVLSCFALFCLILSISGVYGVIAYAVRQRTRELAIRAALGATRVQNRWLVLSQGLLLVMAGLSVGAGTAYFLSRFLEAWTYGISHRDPGTFAACAAVVAAVAMLACYVPAHRSTRIDPATALRGF